jgi:hypothetical protein
MFASAMAARHPTGPAPTTTSFLVIVGVSRIGGDGIEKMLWMTRSPPEHLTLAYLRGYYGMKKCCIFFRAFYLVLLDHAPYF